VAEAADVKQLGDFMTGANGKPGTHTAQVFVFDREARLCFRTGDAPSPDEILALLTLASATG
jgi:protein SCO1/2